MFALVATSYKNLCVKANNPDFHRAAGVLSTKGTRAWMLDALPQGVYKLGRIKRLNACQMFTVNRNQQHAVYLPPPRCDCGNQRKRTKGFRLFSTNWNLDQLGTVLSQIMAETENH